LLPASLALLAALALGGCSREGAVRTRAAYDFNCPEEKVAVDTISSFDASFGARGCGKRASYKWGSDTGVVLNSPIQAEGATSGGAAPPK
jgi:hypothetical protein